MAEAVGLTLGVIALAGTFKDCVDLLSYVSAARSFGRDTQILLTKLDIEKTLLLQWGSKMGIGGPNTDPRLKDHSIIPVVQEILQCIRVLLSDSSKMKERYGLKEINERVNDKIGERSNALQDLPGGHLISTPRSTTFQANYEKLRKQMRDSQAQTTVIARLKWAVYDMEKFQRLVEDISHFNAKLRELLPIDNIEWRSLADEDVEAISGNHRALEMLRSATITDQQAHEPLAEAIRLKSIEERVLRCLWFSSMEDRQNAISIPHTHTFEWVYDLPNLDSLWTDLGAWLKSSTGMYWVSGKAGSGKSTLMKFIYQDVRTHELLRIWAGDASLTVASFFFWHLGVLEQKSQIGLMRKLLHDILDVNRENIPLLLPALWKAADQVNDDSWNPTDPSLTQLKLAFAKLEEILQPTTKFCFFIDGLDEYDGDCEEATHFVKSLTKSPWIKVITSSRPEPACFAAFHHCPSLRVQEMTKVDIEKYVSETIATHAEMHGVMKANPEAATDLISDIVNKAAGVFLWVVLACRSLLQGFAFRDGINELCRRINDLPPELESLFQHILYKISPRYRIPAAKVLRFCTQSQLIQGTRPLSTVALAAAMFESENWNGTEKMRHAFWLKKASTCEDVEGWLRSRCWGLVEVKRTTHLQDSSINSPGRNPCVCLSSRECQVQFLHRTVLEFLTQNQAWEHECLVVPEENFDANTILARAMLHLAKLTEISTSPISVAEIDRSYQDIAICIRDIFYYLLAADRSAHEAVIATVEDLQDFVQELKNSRPKKVMPFSHGQLIFSTRAYMYNEQPERPQFMIEADFVVATETERPQIKTAADFILATETERPQSMTKADFVLYLPHQLSIFCIEVGLIEYARYYLLVNGLQSHKTAAEAEQWDKLPILFYAVTLYHIPTTWNLKISPPMVNLLLEKSADPNEKFDYLDSSELTPWRCFIPTINTTDLSHATVSSQIVKMFLEHGADPNAAGIASDFTPQARQRDWKKLRTEMEAKTGCPSTIEEVVNLHFRHNPLKYRPKGWTSMLDMGESLMSLIRAKQIG